MKQELLKAGYKKFTQPDEVILFQKRVDDDKGIKYFINCYMYIINNEPRFEFNIQISTEYGDINTKLFNTTLNIKKIEDFMEDLWFYYGKNYNEKFTISEKDNKLGLSEEDNE